MSRGETFSESAAPAADPRPAEATVQKLVVLPFNKSVEIAFKSIRVRFLRSLITTLSLVLAVAFFAFANVGNDVANGFLSSGDPHHRQILVQAGFDLQSQETSVASSPKQRWILMLSLLVCVVGIVNAQLMAVTERFREIGTMKCLGALDRFILRLFLLEAGFQGLAGATAGALLGGLVALLSGALQFGWLALTLVLWKDVLVTLLISVAVGVVLSLVGVLYPAIVASHMQPVEAMRAEA